MKDTWTKLSYAIKEIQNHNVSKLSYEEHYRYAYNMVLFKRELELSMLTVLLAPQLMCQMGISSTMAFDNS